MISLVISLFQRQGFFGQLAARIQEGGPVSMSLILVLLLLVIFFIVRAGLKLKSSNPTFQKQISLINQLTLLALVIGLFSQFIGLIQVFDAFESLGNINPNMFAGGIKLTLLPPLFGSFVFLVGRIATFILNWVRNEKAVSNVNIQ